MLKGSAELCGIRRFCSFAVMIFKIFTYLFGCQVLVVACRIFSWGMWHLVPWSGIKLRSPALEARSLSHWTTTKAPGSSVLKQIYTYVSQIYVPLFCYLSLFPHSKCSKSGLYLESLHSHLSSTLQPTVIWFPTHSLKICLVKLFSITKSSRNFFIFMS